MSHPGVSPCSERRRPTAQRAPPGGCPRSPRVRGPRRVLQSCILSNRRAACRGPRPGVGCARAPAAAARPLRPPPTRRGPPRRLPRGARREPRLRRPPLDAAAGRGGAHRAGRLPGAGVQRADRDRLPRRRVARGAQPRGCGGPRRPLPRRGGGRGAAREGARSLRGPPGPPRGPGAARVRGERLRRRLEEIERSFGPRWLRSDPVELVRGLAAPEDREVAAFLASALAYGNVVQIRRSVEEALRRMEGGPRAFLERLDRPRARRAFEGFVHRFHRGEALASLSWILSRMLRRSGSLEAFFAEGGAGPSVREGIASFSARALSLGEGGIGRAERVRFFFSSPDGGSACKRLCLFLRWVVRPDDGVDLGLWTRISRSALVLPLDVHLWRLVRCLGLTRYATPGWNAAEEATAALRRLDPEDPLRFDFALCRLGMLARCPRPRDARPCSACPRRRRGVRRGSRFADLVLAGPAAGPRSDPGAG